MVNRKPGNEKGIYRVPHGYIVKLCCGKGIVHQDWAKDKIEARKKLAALQEKHDHVNPLKLRMKITDRFKSGVVGVHHSVHTDKRRRGHKNYCWRASWSANLDKPKLRSFCYGTKRTEEEAFNMAILQRIKWAYKYGGKEAGDLVVKQINKWSEGNVQGT